MKFIVVFVLIFLFMVFIGIPYKYERDSFTIIDSKVIGDINLSIDPTVKKSFLGIHTLKVAPYKVSIFCFEKSCMPSIESVSIEIGNSNIVLSNIAVVTTGGGMSTISPPVAFNHEFKHDQEFKVSAKLGEDFSNLNSMVWAVRFQKSEGFSFIPLWIYFTH